MIKLNFIIKNILTYTLLFNLKNNDKSNTFTTYLYVNTSTKHIKYKIIFFKSDNLEWGVTIDDGKLIGQNLFGFAMMEIRDVLCDVYENYDLIDWDLSGSPYSKERCSCNHVH